MSMFEFYNIIKEEKSVKVFIFLIFLSIVFSIFISPVFIFIFLYKNYLIFINHYLLALIILIFSSIIFTYIYILNLYNINRLYKNKNKNTKPSEFKMKIIINCIYRSIVTMFVMAIVISMPICKYIFINGTSINVTELFLGIIILSCLISFIFNLIQRDTNYDDSKKEENDTSKKIENIKNMQI